MLICQVQERDPGWLLPHVRARTVEPRAGRAEDEGSEATRAAPQQAVGGHEGLPQGPDHHQQIMSPRPFLLSSLFTFYCFVKPLGISFSHGAIYLTLDIGLQNYLI